MLPHYARLFYTTAVRAIEHLNMQEWLLVLACAAALGLLCMRGFGSRSSQ